MPLKVIPDLFRSLISVLRKIKDVFEHVVHMMGVLREATRPSVGTQLNLIFCCCFLTKGGYCIAMVSQWWEGITITK